MSATNKTPTPAGTPPDAPAAWEPRIVAFLCNWCSYAGADLAGVSRMQYPANVRIIRVPCSGRVNPMYIVKALQQGIDGVLVSGCHPGDCHYISGNLVARRKFAMLSSFLEFLGIEAGRVQFSWVSASEGNRFADLMKKVTDDVRKLGPAKQLKKESIASLAASIATIMPARAADSSGTCGTAALGCAEEAKASPAPTVTKASRKKSK